MTIDKDRLVELLIEKTSMSREEVKSQLNQLIERILDAAERGKALEITGFGFFYFNDRNELKFDPSEDFRTEINYKYEGLKPVEVKSGRKTSADDSSKEQKRAKEEEDNIEEENEDEAIDISFRYAEMKPVDYKSDWEYSEFHPLNMEDDEFEAEDTDNSYRYAGMKPVERRTAWETSRADSFKTEKTKSEEDDYDSFGSGRAKYRSSKSHKRKKNRTGGIVLAVIIIIAVLIGAYFYFTETRAESNFRLVESGPVTSSPSDPSVPLNPDGESTVPSQVRQENGANVTSRQNLEKEENARLENTQNAEPSGSLQQRTVQSKDVSQSTYGLKGSIVEEANNGYSIVLYSFTDEENANSAARRLKNENYRVMTITRNVDGNRIWRVSVGQFQTLNDARRATSQLPSPYYERNFIQKYSYNSNNR